MRDGRVWTGGKLVLALGLALVTVVPAAADSGELIFVPRAPSGPAAPAGPPKGVSASFQLDDGTAEGDIGVGGITARQFLWFNRFTVPGPFELSEIRVLFRPSGSMTVGDSVQLAVYSDPDGDPANGATLLATYDRVIEALDGTTFSIYPLTPPLQLVDGGDVLIGAIDRFVVSGVTPNPILPAAIDNTDSQVRSWIGLWTGDPPDPPILPPDNVYGLIDDVIPQNAGNWMIRGVGRPRSATEIPTLGGVGMALLAAVLGVVGIFGLRRRRTAGLNHSPEVIR
ncbi:MAG: hypothetical protein K8E66_01900 [Phycisphaerales bacterium]|nr:hypothetical protein [Phycisphaerales bacterium]